MKIVKCLPEFEFFTVFLKNRNFISKIRISKVTDYVALNIQTDRPEQKVLTKIRPLLLQERSDLG